MGGHGHSHGCGQCNCDDGFEIATDFALHTKISEVGFECMGEEEDGTGRKVFKDYENRHDREDFVISDCDPELLFNFKFDGNVKLKSLIVIGGDDDEEPTKLRMFKNKEGLTFDDVNNGKADQDIDLVTDPRGDVQYPLKTTKFNNVHHLSLFFPESKGGDQTKIYYIGLRGEFTKVSREAIVITNYEIAANPADHKNPLLEGAGHQIQ